MKKILAILLSAILFAGCSSSVEGASGSCTQVGEIVKTETEFKVCLNVDSSKSYFISGKYFDKAIFLGQIAIFNSSLVSKDGWYEGFREKIAFNSTLHAQYISKIFDASNALASIEEITNGEQRWDSLIGAMTLYSEAFAEYQGAVKTFFDSGPSSPNLEMNRREMNQASSVVSQIYKAKLSEQLPIFLNYLRAETGLTNEEAGRVTLDFLAYENSK